MGFRFVPKLVTLNNLERRNGLITVILRFFSEIGSFRSALRKRLKIYLNFLRQKYSPKLVVFSDISLTMI